MSLENNMDILRNLSKDEIIKMKNILKTFKPKSIRAYNYLTMQLKWMKQFNTMNSNDYNNLSNKFKIKFYTHRYGKLENCTFISLSSIEDYIVFAFTLEESVTELSECFYQTKLIKWDRGPWLWSMETDHLNCVKALIMDKQLQIQYEVPNQIYYLLNNNAKMFQFSIPENVLIKPLNADRDAAFINLHWPLKSKHSNSELYIKSMIILNGGLGIFDKTSEHLMSWIMLNEMSALGALQTVDSEKCKGYGTLIIKAFCKQLAYENMDMLALILQNNQASINLFEKLGFQMVNTCAWLKLHELNKIIKE